MSSTHINKSYQAIVTMSDDTDIAFDVEVSYYDEDSMCVPDINVSIVEQPEDRQGMVEEFEDEIVDALDTWFTKDACNQNDGEHLCFTFDMVLMEVELCEYETTEDPQIAIDKAIEQIKQDVSNGDLTAVEELLKLTPLSIVKGYLAED